MQLGSLKQAPMRQRQTGMYWQTFILTEIDDGSAWLSEHKNIG